MIDDANPIVLDEDREPMTLYMCQHIKERLTYLAGKRYLTKDELIEYKVLLRAWKMVIDKGIQFDFVPEILDKINTVSEHEEFTYMYYRLEEIKGKLVKYGLTQAELKALDATELHIYMRLSMEGIILSSVIKMHDDIEEDISSFIKECRKERILPSEN